MKNLLRSCFKAAHTDVPELLLRNYHFLNDAGLEFEVSEDRVIWTEIKEFIQRHNHVPEAGTLKTHFQHVGETQALDRVEQLMRLPVLVGGDFMTLLEDRAEDRRLRTTLELFKDAGAIMSSGMEVQEGKVKRKLRGPVDAIRHVLDRSHEIVAPTLGTRLSGEVTQDGEDFTKRYERVEADPLAGVGQHSGLVQMDHALNGAKRYELWTHAAFTGGMKSTLALNWAYNQAVYYLHSTLFFSLEMPYNQCRNILYAMHSAHPKFKLIRYWLGLQTGVDETVGLPYKDIRDGTLHEYHKNARRFLFEFVVKDFNGNEVDVDHHPDTGDQYKENGKPVLASLNVDKCNFEVSPPILVKHPSPAQYGKIHIEVADPDKDDFTVADMRHRADVIYSKTPFSMLTVDHAGLMASRRYSQSTTERLNEVLRDLKRLAMSFQRGMGIAVMALFQINREGYKAALKRKEKAGRAEYDLTHLSYANEAERSSDVVTASWLDTDLRKENKVQIQCLKSRDQEPFETFYARVEWPCRRLLTCFDPVMTEEQHEKVGTAVDKAAEAQVDDELDN